MDVYIPSLVDAQERHRMFPDTFAIPSDEELNALTIGYSAKISNGSERFWVRIVDVIDDFFIGIIANHLITPNIQYNFQDKISFGKENVFAINPPHGPRYNHEETQNVMLDVNQTT